MTARRRELVAEEFADVDLGKPRRDRRAQAIAQRLAAQPAAGLPGAMLDRAMLEPLYRHLSNDYIGFDTLIGPCLKRTAERIAAAGDVYAVHDTTICTFPGEGERSELGRIRGEKRGLMAHVALAVSAEGDRLSFGVLAAELMLRGDKPDRRTRMMRRADSQSHRWRRGVDSASARVRSPEHLIHVADREGDFYELLADLVAKRRRFIIRAQQNRAIEVDGAFSNLFNAAQETGPTYAVEVPIARRRKGVYVRAQFPVRDARIANLSIAALSVTLRRPECVLQSQPESLPVNVVHVFELGPPLGQPPIEWVLLTSEPIATRNDIECVVDGYRMRWTIAELWFANMPSVRGAMLSDASAITGARGEKRGRESSEWTAEWPSGVPGRSLSSDFPR